MRPVDDLVERTRNWLWYWIVRRQTGLSNDALDMQFLGPGANGGRRRHFERIGQTASSPRAFPVKGGKTLFKLVNEAGHTEAGLLYESKLWEFLSERDAPPQVYSDFIAEYVKAKGWHRLHARDVSLYITLLGENEPAVQPDVSTAYSAMLHKLVNEATFEALAVLVALFREAMGSMLLKQAIAIQTAVKAAATWTCMRNEIPELPKKLLEQLVSDRVLGNRWFTEEDWRHHANVPRKKKMSTRERAKEFHAWVDWYIKESWQAWKTPYGNTPIVPRSERIDWLETNRVELVSIKNHISELKQEHWMFGDSVIPEYKAYGESALAKANALLKQCIAPDSKPERFYSTRPPLEIGFLPKAF